MNYVIIGNSIAAVGCIEGIRKNDKESKITVISKENHHVYGRPLISYLLLGRTSEEKMKYRPQNFYSDNGCEVLYNKTANKIDRENKCVIIDDGTKILYDKLLIATGSVPFVPPMKGLEEVDNKFSFMTLDDATSLNSVLSKDKKVLVVGAGLIGLKCVEGILQKVSNITVIDLAPRILPSILDEKGSEIVKSHLENKGVKFILSDSVEHFDKNKAYLNSKQEVDFDILVVAVGVRPCVSLAKDANLTVNRGIATNINCQTDDENIYAAGDCAESYDITANTNRILALLPNAYMQGECAGYHMAGVNKPYDNAMPLNSIGFFDLHMITAGSYDGDEVIVDVKDGYKKFYIKDDLLKGFILINCIERAGIYTSLIREKTPLSSIDFELVKQKPQLMAFTTKKREQMLGGAN